MSARAPFRPASLKVARALAARALGLLERSPSALRLAVTGEVRRMEPVVQRVELLATAHEAAPLLDALAEAPFVAETLERRTDTVLARTKDGVALHLRVLEDEAEFGATLFRTTGPDTYVRRLLGTRALRPAPEETDVYAQLDAAWQPPEVRHRLDAGGAAALDLVGMGQVVGIAGLHAGSGSGRYGFAELASRAAREGYAWAIVDGGDPGFYEPRRIVEDNAFVAIPAVTLPIPLRGEITPPADSVLGALRIACLEPTGPASGDEVLGALVRGATSPHVDVVTVNLPEGVHAHGGRDAWEPLARACAHAEVALGVPPPHLGFDPQACLEAAHLAGARLLLLADAYDLNSVDDLVLTVGQARRAAVPTSEVLNTLDLPAFEAWRRRRRQRAETA